MGLEVGEEEGGGGGDCAGGVVAGFNWGHCGFEFSADVLERWRQIFVVWMMWNGPSGAGRQGPYDNCKECDSHFIIRGRQDLYTSDGGALRGWK